MTESTSAQETPRMRFYFDYISSNAYLAWEALPKLRSKYAVEVESVPVLFAGLLGAHGQVGPAEVPVKALWMWKNNLRKAALLGVPLNVPAYHPFNPLLSLRVTTLVTAPEERAALVDRLFRAVWVEGRHVSEPEVVVSAAREVGLDGAGLVTAAGQSATKARLREETDAAIAAGVFGVPTMVVGEELFWGYDDFPYLELALAGKDPIDSESVPAAVPRASATRRRA